MRWSYSRKRTELTNSASLWRAFFYYSYCVVLRKPQGSQVPPSPQRFACSCSAAGPHGGPPRVPSVAAAAISEGRLEKWRKSEARGEASDQAPDVANFRTLSTFKQWIHNNELFRGQKVSLDAESLFIKLLHFMFWSTVLNGNESGIHFPFLLPFQLAIHLKS